jgi:hypothetical protein
MRNEAARLVRMVGGAPAKRGGWPGIGQNVVALETVPFAADPADTGEVTDPGPFALQFSDGAES